MYIYKHAWKTLVNHKVIKKSVTQAFSFNIGIDVIDVLQHMVNVSLIVTREVVEI